MIELYDATRLTVKRDHTLALASSTLLVASGLMAAYTAFLQLQLHGTQSRTQALQAQLAALDTPGSKSKPSTPAAAASPRAALMADLQRQAEQLEREARHAGPTTDSTAAVGTPTAAQWMDHLAALTLTETSLQKVDIERGGSARIEGLATSPQALNALVRAWEKQDGLAQLQPRSIEVKQEKLPAPFLRFQLRATPVPPAPGRAATTAAPAASAEREL